MARDTPGHCRSRQLLGHPVHQESRGEGGCSSACRDQGLQGPVKSTLGMNGKLAPSPRRWGRARPSGPWRPGDMKTRTGSWRVGQGQLDDLLSVLLFCPALERSVEIYSCNCDCV